MVTVLILALVVLALSSSKADGGGSPAGSPGLTWSAKTKQAASAARRTTMRAGMVLGKTVVPTYQDSATSSIASTKNLKTPGDWVYSDLAENLGLPWEIEIVRTPRTTDERHGGLDFEIEPQKFWRCTIRLRPPEILSDGYPTLESFRNRMPYDHGRLHRRWWMTDLVLRYPNGTLTPKMVVHDGYRSAENIQNYILDERFTDISYKPVGLAMLEYAYRRLESPVASHTENEKKIPGGEAHWFPELVFFHVMTFIIFNNPAFVVFCRNTHKTFHDSSHSFFVGTMGPYYMKWAGELHSYAVHLIGEAVEVIVSLVGAILSAIGSQAWDEFASGIAEMVADAYRNVKEYFPDVEDFQRWLLSKVEEYKNRAGRAMQTVSETEGVTPDLSAPMEPNEMVEEYVRMMNDEIMRDDVLLPFLGSIKKMTIILPEEGD